MAVVEFDQAAFKALNFTGKIIGSNDDIVYIGGGANESFIGGVGNDSFTGAGGNDAIDGAGGTDTVRFTGKRSEYSLTKRSDGSVTVTDNTAGRDGVDTVRNVESLMFSDTSIDPATIASLRDLFVANPDTAKGLASAYEVLQAGVPNEAGFTFLINGAVSTNFRRSDFTEMAERLAGIKGRFVLSLNDRPEVRQVFAGFRFADVGLTYTVAGGVGSKVGEVIILDNKEPGVANLPRV
tara:strand:- start:2295 stop:3008 length:714 start_codon:yes stop_codon:yes gene_type:complete